MRTISKVACCIALVLSVNTLPAYYYHSGYYNREDCCEYGDVNCDESYDNCDNCNTCGYQSYWYQGSLNPFILLIAYSQYSNYNSPYGPPSQYYNAQPLSGTDSYVADKVRTAISKNKSVSSKNISVYVKTAE